MPLELRLSPITVERLHGDNLPLFCHPHAWHAPESAEKQGASWWGLVLSSSCCFDSPLAPLILPSDGRYSPLPVIATLKKTQNAPKQRILTLKYHNFHGRWLCPIVHTHQKIFRFLFSAVFTLIGEGHLSHTFPRDLTLRSALFWWQLAHTGLKHTTVNVFVVQIWTKTYQHDP